MGDLADDMIDGASCSHCGVYFDEEHGYPVLCKDCHREDHGQSQLPKASFKETT